MPSWQRFFGFGPTLRRLVRRIPHPHSQTQCLVSNDRTVIALKTCLLGPEAIFLHTLQSRIITRATLRPFTIQYRRCKEARERVRPASNNHSCYNLMMSLTSGCFPCRMIGCWTPSIICACMVRPPTLMMPFSSINGKYCINFPAGFLFRMFTISVVNNSLWLRRIQSSCDDDN